MPHFEIYAQQLPSIDDQGNVLHCDGIGGLSDKFLQMSALAAHLTSSRLLSWSRVGPHTQRVGPVEAAGPMGVAWGGALQGHARASAVNAVGQIRVESSTCLTRLSRIGGPHARVESVEPGAPLVERVASCATAARDAVGQG